MKLIVQIKDIAESISDYWNGDRNDAAMYDALLHMKDRLDEIIDLSEEIQVSNVLDYAWKYI